MTTLRSFDPETRLFLPLLLGVTALRLATLALTPLDLHGDEAQYWLWSRDLEWGYYSKPPLVAWAIAASTAVFGNDPWAVRFFAPVAHAAGALILFLLGRRAYGGGAGLLAGLGWLLMPGVWLSASVITTDALMLPLWAAALYCAWRLVEGGGLGWALALGAALGFGVLAKYGMLYFLLGAALAALVSEPARRAFLSLRGAAAAAIAALVVAPNLAWNAANGFATVTHTAANANWQGDLLNPEQLLAFWIDQFGVAGPIAFVAFLVVAVAVVRNWRGASEADRFLLSFAVPALVLISVQALISRAHGNWAAAAYPAIVVLIAGRLRASVNGRRTLWASHGLNAVVGALFTAAALSPAIADAMGLSNAFKRARAWEETAAAVAAEAAKGGYSAILADRRMLYSSLAYAWRDEAPAPPLRMWVLRDAPTNFAEQTAPMTPDLGGRTLIVSTADGLLPLVIGDFVAAAPPRQIEIDIGAGRSRKLTFVDAQGFDPAVRDAAFLARIDGGGGEDDDR
jgi:4-amino-4-deoxy-L-arabinose transferase-like glycosyltransferase